MELHAQKNLDLIEKGRMTTGGPDRQRKSRLSIDWQNTVFYDFVNLLVISEAQMGSDLRQPMMPNPQTTILKHMSSLFRGLAFLLVFALPVAPFSIAESLDSPTVEMEFGDTDAESVLIANETRQNRREQNPIALTKSWSASGSGTRRCRMMTDTSGHRLPNGLLAPLRC